MTTAVVVYHLDRLDSLGSLAVEKVAGHTFDVDAAKTATARFKRL